MRSFVTDLDIWRSANELIKQYGEDAAIHAAMKADRMLARGDVEGAAVWRRIMAGIGELSTTKPRPNAERL